MPHVVADRVKETTTTTGTGAVTLAGAVVNFRTFASVLANGDRTPYVIVHQTAAEWETGIGTFSAGVLTRTEPLAGSSGTPVNFSAGTKDVFISPLANAPVNFEEGTEPPTPNTGQATLYAADQDDVTMMRMIADDGIIRTLHQDSYFVVRNTTGVTLDRGRAVYLSGSAGQRPTVALARADSDATMPAIGIVAADIPNNTQGLVCAFGHLFNLPLGGFNDGDVVYVSESTFGLITATEPPHPNLKQRVGIITNAHGGQGKLLVSPAAIRGNHEGTNRPTWVVGDQLTGQKSITFRRDAADHVLRSPDSGTARTFDLPDISGKIIVNTGRIDDYIDVDGALPEPGNPGATDGRLYARGVVMGQKVSPKWKTPLGVSYVLQPSLFQQMVSLFGAGAGTTVGIFGTTVTSVGTVSHQAPTATSPVGANFISAATGNATCGTGHNGTPLLVGNVTDIVGGFFCSFRFWGPDASYSDYRIFAGNTSTTMVLTVSETPSAWTGHRCGFYAASDHPSIPGRWYFRTRNGTTTSEVAIGTRDFVAREIYDGYIFIPKGGTTMYWRLDNLTADWTEEGSTTLTLPGATTALRGGVQLSNVTAVARNVRLQRAYFEQDV